MAFLHDDVLDAALQEIISSVDALHLCSQEPASYAEATSTYSLGVKTNPSITSQGDGTSGRKVEVEVFNDGEQTDSGTAHSWALVDTVTSRLIAAGALATPAAMVGSGAFALTSPFAITITDAWSE